jgi:dTDP-4-amino-4,6-dideoxygalactose transaminase
MLDTVDAAGRMAGVAAVMATHVFGSPCHPERVEGLAAAEGVPVLFDAAHALGACRRGRPVGGFGAAEVFSLSPTKPVVAGEGGLVATDDDDLAARIRLGRDYGKTATYDSAFAGLNARLSELHAALALESLHLLDEHLARRRHLAACYRRLLDPVPGISPQQLDEQDVSTYKFFSVVVDEATFGTDRNTLALALGAEGVDTRTYFSPPVHRHEAYRELATPELPRTDSLASRVISLPLWRDLDDAAVETVAAVVARVHEHADALGDARRSA